MSLGYPKKQKRRFGTLLRKYAREVERTCDRSRHYSQHLARSLALITRELESDLTWGLWLFLPS